MAKNIEFVGSERQVNIGLTGGDQGDAEIVALPNGNFVVVYESHPGGPEVDVLWQEFTAAGVALTGPNPLDLDGNDFIPDVAGRSNNGFVAVWNESGGNSIKLAVVNPGVFTEPVEFTVEDPVLTANAPSVATFANGSYIVTYSVGAFGAIDLRLAIVNAAGNGYDQAPANLAADPVDQFNPSVATFGNTAAVVYERGDGDHPSASAIVLKVLNSAGTFLDTETVADPANLENPDVAALSDGRFAIVWQSDFTGDVFGRIYDPASGTFSGAAFTVSNAGGVQEEPRVIGLPDGGFLVSWTDASAAFGDTTGPAINARRFDSGGAPVGDEFRLSTGTLNEQNDSAIAADGAGNLFGVWTNNNTTNTTDDSLTGIQGQFLRTVTEIVNGTDDTDTISTYSLSERINGRAGDDTIFAAGGNDIIDGGLGADTMRGGLGNDTYVVDDASIHAADLGDVVDETGGSGTDLVLSSVSFNLSNAVHAKGAIENLTLFGSANINATGNALANILTGNAAANILNGAGGADTMRGGAGNDRYVVNSAGDIADESAPGSNGALDGVLSSIDFSLSDAAHAKGAIERLRLTGDDSIDGTGNALANLITGNGAANTLSGLEGKDIVRGGVGNDRLFGGVDDDVLVGGLGRDRSTGGAGADRFDFDDIAESVVGGLRDVILDFRHGQGDRIDLSTIDANTAAVGNQKFVFIGSEGFAHYRADHPGAIALVRFSGGVLQGNVNANLAADFEIKVIGSGVGVADLIL